MKKEKIIEQIQSIVSDNGGYIGSGEMELEADVCIGSIGDIVGLIEQYNYDTVDVSVYDDDILIKEYLLFYSQLKKEILLEILFKLNEYNSIIE